jgi:diguanylate cyclase (GGDEF)-like protein
MLHGSLWGALPAYFFAESAPPQQFVIACLCVATLFGGSFALSMVPVAMVAHVAPIAIGSTVAILTCDNPIYDAVAGMTLIYTTVMVGAAMSRAAVSARRRAAEIAVEEGALRDELTQLPNRAAFRDELAKSFARHARLGERFALMCFDLDNFKSVNDTMGHIMGDRLLVEAARRLRATTREADMVARLGGDEFALIAVDIKTMADATAIAERIVAAFREPFEVQGRDFPITISVGVAVAPSDGVDPDSLLRNADSALYATKHSGRSGYTFFRERFGFVAEKMTLEAELDRALAKGELYMVFQPFVNVATLKTTGFEALLRWRHPVRGPLGALEIVPLFERSGLIDAVGAWAIEESIAIAAGWPAHLRLAVNVSALQLRKLNFDKTVTKALEKYSFDPGRLELELTESAMILDGDVACATLGSLRRMGVKTALDDLGTGYSSLANLVELPLDRLKIDRSFVANLETNPMCAPVVKLAVELARSLALEVTAEGVEDRRQLELLRSYGCSEVQGYLFSQPRPANQLAHLLEFCPVSDAPRVADVVAAAAG